MSRPHPQPIQGFGGVGKLPLPSLLVGRCQCKHPLIVNALSLPEAQSSLALQLPKMPLLSPFMLKTHLIGMGYMLGRTSSSIRVLWLASSDAVSSPLVRCYNSASGDASAFSSVASSVMLTCQVAHVALADDVVGILPPDACR